jgi:hypothetical protein
MALALPILLLMFLGLVELAFLLRANLVVVNANREAARYAARGKFTDEQIARRAVQAFSKRLPVETGGPDANTQIIITRFHCPPGDNAEVTYTTPYISGTLGLESKIADLDAYADKLEGKHDEFNDELVRDQGDAARTEQDIVYVEIYYYHYEVLHAPVVEWLFPDPMVVYAHTVMRMMEGRLF